MKKSIVSVFGIIALAAGLVSFNAGNHGADRLGQPAPAATTPPPAGSLTTLVPTPCVTGSPASQFAVVGNGQNQYNGTVTVVWLCPTGGIIGARVSAPR